MVEEPPALQARPHVGGLPVPYITAWIGGHPDFKVHDEVRRAECAGSRLCQLCGTSLDAQVAFAGTEGSIERRTFGEPPAHPACMAYAFSVCPWLGGKPYVMKHRSVGVTTLPPPLKEPPEMGILITDGFWLVDDDEGVTDFKYRAAEPLKIEWRKRG